MKYLYLNGRAHIRKIAKDLDMQPITVSRILKETEKQKIVASAMEANLKYYSLNYSNFKTIGLLTWIENKRIMEIGLESLLLSLVGELKAVDVEFCIIYGSSIRGTARERSDIDIFFVSEAKNIAEICRRVSVLTGKDISPHVLSEKQFKKLLREEEAFVANTILRPANRIFLLGLEKFLKLYV